MSSADAFPLQWPLGYQRTKYRQDSRFKQTMEGAQRFLRDELSRMGARNVVISSNIPVRNDGGLYSAYMHKKMDDPGVAVYFKYKDQDVVMCCDRYRAVWENVYALGKGIEALRGMERWGVSEFMERAFTGFTAIEAPREKDWFDILEVRSDCTPEAIKANYRRLCKDWHPDIKGIEGEQRIRELNNAYEKAKAVKNFV